MLATQASNVSKPGFVLPTAPQIQHPYAFQVGYLLIYLMLIKPIVDIQISVKIHWYNIKMKTCCKYFNTL